MHEGAEITTSSKHSLNKYLVIRAYMLDFTEKNPHIDAQQRSFYLIALLNLRNVISGHTGNLYKGPRNH